MEKNYKNLLSDRFMYNSFDFRGQNLDKKFNISTDDEKITLTVRLAGHTTKSVDVNLLEDEVYIRATVPKELENNPIIENLDLKFSIGKDYDGTTASGSIKDGILTIVFEKRENKKSKKLKFFE